MSIQGVIALSKREQFELNTLAKFRNGDLTRAHAAELLGLSERQVTRKSKKIRENGVKGVIHANSGKTPVNKTSEETKARFIDLYQTTYSNFNMTHALEMIKKEHDLEIPYSVFRRWCDEAKIQKFRNRKAKPRVFRQRFAAEGIMLQMDGSPHMWNGRIEWCLISMIDDATSEVPHAEFFPAEDTLSCMQVLRRVIERKGIPVSIYVDRAGIYGGTAKRFDFAQFGRACKELGIEVIFANSPQGKGRVERSFRTYQDRLLAELHHYQHFTIPAANAYLHEQFLPNYWNERLTVEPKSTKSHYRILPPETDLDEIFCMIETRVVKADHTISIDNVHYQIMPPSSFSIANRSVQIRTYIDKPWKIYFNDKPCEFKKLDTPARKSASMTKKINDDYATMKRARERRNRILSNPQPLQFGLPPKADSSI